MVDVPCFVGIEVAKAPLDVAVRPAGERWAIPHDTSGVVTLVERLRAATAAVATAGLPGVVVNQRQARDWARAPGQVAQTEAWDARALAPCAAVLRTTPRPLPDAPTQERCTL
jgi:transposase